MTEKVYIIGSGGHASVVAEACNLSGRASIYICEGRGDTACTIGESEFFTLDQTQPVICGVGSTASHDLRRKILARYLDRSQRFTSIVHPSATVSPKAKIGRGVFIGQGAQVCANACLQDHVIVNTGAIVDHDCVVGTGSHIAPGAVLSGTVKCGDWVHIGTGAIVIQNVKIADNTIIGAGSVVTKDIEEPGSTWVGVPARVCEK